MKLDRFINRPVLSTVISVLIVILGIIGLATLPVTQYPDIAPPTVQVRATLYRCELHSCIEFGHRPLEDQINGVENMMYISHQHPITVLPILMFTLIREQIRIWRLLMYRTVFLWHKDCCLLSNQGGCDYSETPELHVDGLFIV